MSIGVDLHEEIFDALHAFLKLTLLFHSANWDDRAKAAWVKLQKPILSLATASHLSGPVEATTRGLCDLGRAVIGKRRLE